MAEGDRTHVRDIDERVARFVERHALWPARGDASPPAPPRERGGEPAPGPATPSPHRERGVAGEVTLVVGVSGGADSLCLLGTLLALRAAGHPFAPATLVVAHLDHGLRGADGGADARWVADFAYAQGVQCVTDCVDVRALAREQRRSIEDAARAVRYTFLRRVASAVGADRICVGHTRDDQVETLVMHWLRGAGLEGLSGMAPLTGDIARPLLEITHEEAESYCAARGWQPRHDATNDDRAYQRNRVRHELLPMLKSYNPALAQTLVRNAALIAEDEHYLETQADEAWARVHIAADDDSRVALRRDALRALPAALRHRVWQRAARSLARDGDASGGDPLEARHIVLLDALADHARSGAQQQLPARLRARVEYGIIIVEQVTAEPGETPQRRAQEPLRLTVPGVVELPAQGWRVRAWASERPPGAEVAAEPAPPSMPSFSLTGNTADVQRAEMRVYLDGARAGTLLWVRTWRPGDRFQPLGMQHAKKLQDYFADAKVPRALRHTLPIVANERHPIWLAGLRIDERVRLTPETRRVLVLQLEPLDIS